MKIYTQRTHNYKTNTQPDITFLTSRAPINQSRNLKSLRSLTKEHLINSQIKMEREDPVLGELKSIRSRIHTLRSKTAFKNSSNMKYDDRADQNLSSKNNKFEKKNARDSCSSSSSAISLSEKPTNYDIKSGINLLETLKFEQKNSKKDTFRNINSSSSDSSDSNSGRQLHSYSAKDTPDFGSRNEN